MLRTSLPQVLIAVINFPTLLHMPDYAWLQDTMFPVTGKLTMEKPRKEAQVFCWFTLNVEFSIFLLLFFAE
jgi:hypothetical protein